MTLDDRVDSEQLTDHDTTPAPTLPVSRFARFLARKNDELKHGIPLPAVPVPCGWCRNEIGPGEGYAWNEVRGILFCSAACDEEFADADAV